MQSRRKVTVVPTTKYPRRACGGFTKKISINNITSHEEIISSTLQSASSRFDKVNERLNKFQQRCEKETQSKENIEWIRQYRSLQREQLSLSKLAKSMFESVKVDSEAIIGKGTFEEMTEVNVYDEKIVQSTRDLRRELFLTTQTKSKSKSKCKFPNILQQIRTENCEITNHLNDKYIRLEKEIQNNRMTWDCNPSEGTSPLKELLMEINNIQILCESAKKFNLINDHVYKDVSFVIAEVIDSCQINPQYLLRDHKQIDECSEVDKGPSRPVPIYETCETEKHHITPRYESAPKQQKDSESKSNRSPSKELKMKGAAKIEEDKILKPTEDGYADRWKSMNNNSNRNERNLFGKDKRNKEMNDDPVVSALNRLGNLSVELLEFIWKDTTQFVSDAINEEKKFRFKFLKQINELKQSIEREETAVRKFKKDEEEKVNDERKERQRILTKNKLEAYNFTKYKQEMKELKEQEHTQRQEEKKRQERFAKNSERVKFRNDELVRKKENRSIHMKKAKEDEIEREERLKNLAATVPYYSSINAKKADLTKSTAARLNDIFEPSDDGDLKDFQQGLKKMTGFSDKRVFSDPKFRLAHALHESGKAGSAYSLAVVKHLIPVPKCSYVENSGAGITL